MLRGITTVFVGLNEDHRSCVCGVYSPEPRAAVYCFRLNFNMSKLGYCTDFLRSNKQSGETLDDMIYKLTFTAGEKEADLYMHLGIDL